jgi:hypothetical protein
MTAMVGYHPRWEPRVQGPIGPVDVLRNMGGEVSRPHVESRGRCFENGKRWSWHIAPSTWEHVQTSRDGARWRT